MYIVDETMLKVGSEYIWLWIAIEHEKQTDSRIICIKRENMFVAEYFLSDVIHIYGIHPVFQQMVEPSTQWLVGF
jgi:putative transposase